MDIIRRNTDYALRAAIELAGWFGSAPVSTKEIAESQDIPYQLACKLLQRLNKASIVKSIMGPEGGFMLSRNPAKITVRQVVEAVQGPVRLNRCLFKRDFCRLSRHCTINPEFGRLQKNINAFLDGLSLRQLSSAKTKDKRKRSKK
jgi:Rrf2 family iron-sulfur cluster assembly transcriptional regulator